MRDFIGELRHRNVFRVGVAYVVTGWLVVQVDGRTLCERAQSAPQLHLKCYVCRVQINNYRVR